MMLDNVIPFPKKPAVFTDSQRQALISSVDTTKQPEEIVATMESVLCTQVVAATREVASVAAEALGNKIASWLFGKR
jgi:hypothetical protein